MAGCHARPWAEVSLELLEPLTQPHNPSSPSSPASASYLQAGSFKPFYQTYGNSSLTEIFLRL